LTKAAPRYFISTQKRFFASEFGANVGRYEEVPSLCVWYYGQEARDGSSYGGPLRQMRMERAPADLQGEPTDWEYVFVPSPEDEQVVLYRYRIYPKQGELGTPRAEYEVLEWAWRMPSSHRNHYGYPLDSQAPEEPRPR
jgi:hypothetical protein